MRVIKIFAATLLAGLASLLPAHSDASTAVADTIPQPVVIRAEDFPRYLTLARDSGDYEAARRLAICYIYGTGTDPDMLKAKEWMGRAARHENTEAQYDLGVMYRDGIAMRQNLPDAAYWLRKAARNGHARAQYAVGLLFLEGRGVQADSRIAAENFWRAAEQGDVDAAYRLACMYRDGTGMQKDLSKAWRWFDMAARANYRDAAAQADALKAYAASARRPSATRRPIRRPARR